METATPTVTSTAKSLYEGSCLRESTDGKAIREVLERVGDKWSLLVIATLSESALRFTELHHHIPGISQRMLTRTVRQLERDRLLTRTVFPEVPPRVEYELTAMGRTLIEPSVALARWAIANYPDIESARETFDAAVLT